jgi:hypothetical protein
MEPLDAKIYDYIKSGSDNYSGRALRDIEEKFVWATKGPSKQDVWAALSRLAQAKRIKKSGSIRYKAYKAITPQEITASW